MTWRVLDDGRTLPMSRTEDLLTDGEALYEDLALAIAESAKVTTEARVLVDSVRRGRRVRATSLRIVRPARD
jgi:hypothetical protein